jgi:hypothetical protein
MRKECGERQIHIAYTIIPPLSAQMKRLNPHAIFRRKKKNSNKSIIELINFYKAG